MTSNVRWGRNTTDEDVPIFRSWQLACITGSIFIVIHAIGVLIAAVAACYEIKSILWSGPIFGLTGVVIALASFRMRRPIGFYYGMAAPSVAVGCFSIICGFKLGPDQAQGPIALLVVVFSMISIPAGGIAVLERRRSEPVRYPIPLQFGISSLLWVMVFVAVLFSFCHADNQPGLAIVVLIGYSLFGWRLVRNFRSKQDEANLDIR